MRPPKMEGSLVAFDPGLTTGLIRLVDGVVTGYGEIVFDKLLEALSSLSRTYMLFRADKWVCESWNLYSDAATRLIGDDMVGPQVVGMLKMAAYRGETPLVFQSASAAKGFVKREGYVRSTLFPGMEREFISNHVIDAGRHALYYYWMKESGHG